MEIRNFAPQCRFSACDPKPERKVFYETIGNFTQTDIGYPSHFDKTMSLVQYIQTHVNLSRIDFIFLNNEESRIAITAPMLLSHFYYGGEMDQADIVNLSNIGRNAWTTRDG